MVRWVTCLILMVSHNTWSLFMLHLIVSCHVQKSGEVHDIRLYMWNLCTNCHYANSDLLLSYCRPLHSRVVWVSFLMVLREAWVIVGLHKLTMSLWHYSCVQFLHHYRLIDLMRVCWFCLGTGLWKCNKVFDRGEFWFNNQLCTTEIRLASVLAWIWIGASFSFWLFGV